MLIETFAMWLILCGVIAIIAFKMRSFPVATISSFGFLIAGMKWYQEESDLFVLAMLIGLALILPVAAGRELKL